MRGYEFRIDSGFWCRGWSQWGGALDTLGLYQRMALDFEMSQSAPAKAPRATLQCFVRVIIHDRRNQARLLFHPLPPGISLLADQARHIQEGHTQPLQASVCLKMTPSSRRARVSHGHT